MVITGSSHSAKGTPNSSAYAASKTALRSLARSWILELADRHIRVNVVSPGPTETELLMGQVSPEERVARRETYGKLVPLGRLPPGEIGQAVLYLASDAASFVNGVELYVDGGYAQV